MSDRDEVRRRIVRAAARLLEEHGLDAVTTRAVSTAAGVQPPTIYRQFTDMEGLLDAVATDGFETYLGRKHSQELTDDPVEDLRVGWNLHLEFGLEYPAHYLLMYGRHEAARRPAVAQRADERLHMLVERVAAAGRLTVSVVTGTAMVGSAGTGTTLRLIETPPEARDVDVSYRMREATIAAITGEEPATAPGYVQHAAALRASLPDIDGQVTAGERALLGELLDRLADTRTT